MARDPGIPRTSGGNVNYRAPRLGQVEAWIAARKAQGIGFEPMPDPNGPMPIDDPVEICAAFQAAPTLKAIWKARTTADTTSSVDSGAVNSREATDTEIEIGNRTLLVTDNAECVEAGERIVAMFRDGEPVEVQEVAL